MSSNVAVAGDKDSSAEEGEISLASPGAEMINVSEQGARPVIVSPVSQITAFLLSLSGAWNVS